MRCFCLCYTLFIIYKLHFPLNCQLFDTLDVNSPSISKDGPLCHRSRFSEEVKTLFVNDVSWSIVVSQKAIDGNIESYETDMSEYAIAGSITDNRDGTITVKMGRYKEEELLVIPVAVAPKSRKEAVELRSAIENAAQSLDDQVALTAKTLYPEWSELVAKSFVAKNAGFKFRHGNSLYKTISANTTFAAHWVPDNGTESLYVRIDEAHAGTISDPIPYSGNMALENGKYYVQDGAVYLCNRDTVNAVYNALVDLVGMYVEAVAV